MPGLFLLEGKGPVPRHTPGDNTGPRPAPQFFFEDFIKKVQDVRDERGNDIWQVLWRSLQRRCV